MSSTWYQEPADLADVAASVGWRGADSMTERLAHIARQKSQQVEETGRLLANQQQQAEQALHDYVVAKSLPRTEQVVNMRQQFISILKMPQVQRVGYDPDWGCLVVETTTIRTPELRDGSIRTLGRYDILLPGPGMVNIQFKALDWGELNGDSPFPHPHVYADGKPCLGLIDLEVPRLVQLGRLDLLVDLSIRFLEAVNYSSLLGDPYSWPVDETSEVDQAHAWAPGDGSDGEETSDTYECDFCGENRSEVIEAHDDCLCCLFCEDAGRGGVYWTAAAEAHHQECEAMKNGWLTCQVCQAPVRRWPLYYASLHGCPNNHPWCGLCQRFNQEEHDHRQDPMEADAPPLARQQQAMHDQLLRQVRAQRQATSRVTVVGTGTNTASTATAAALNAQMAAALNAQAEREAVEAVAAADRQARRRRTQP